MDNIKKVPSASYPPPKMPPAQTKQCEHKFIYMETSRQHGEDAWIGVRPGKEWKRVDRFFCEKCLEFKEITKTEMCYKDKPEWFD